MDTTIDLVLFGLEPTGGENLALRVLAREALEAGYEARVVGVPSLERCASALDEALALRPRVLGFTLQDSVSAIRTLPLSTLARRRGFPGFIVCGGPFATLQTDWVLGKTPAVDGVIRHAGERPLLALLAALGDGAPLSIPGLATRAGETPLTSADWAQPSAWRPLRGPRPEILGVPTAEIIASLGCRERCDYCTHAAVAGLALRECRDAGVTREEIERSGLGRTVRRPVHDLADEMAALYHEDHVRYFQFVDENPVPDEEAGALAWIRDLRAELASRRVGDIAMSILSRGDRLTETVIDALVDLGLVRTLIGIESGTLAGLRGLGRSGCAERGRAALAFLERRGVATMFNSLLIHPESTLDTIEAEIDFLSTVGSAMYETVEAAPFAGTALNARMSRSGRLIGGTLLPQFSTGEPGIERFRVLRTRLRIEALGSYTPSFRAHDILLSAAILRRIRDDRRARSIEARILTEVGRFNVVRLQALRALVDACRTGVSAEAVIREAARSFSGSHAALRDIGRELTSLTGPGSRISRHCYNFAAAAALLFALAQAPACDLPPENYRVIPEDGGDGSDADTDADADGDTDIDSDTSTEPAEACPEEYSELWGLLDDNCEQDEEDSPVHVRVLVDTSGQVEDVDILSFAEEQGDDEPAWAKEMAACYEELLAGETFPCLADADLEMWIRDWGTPV